MLCGHVHEGSSWSKSNIYGCLFVSIAPSNWSYNLRQSDINHSIGYSIIDYDFVQNQIEVHNRRYSHNKKEFVANTEIGDDNGIFKEKLPDSDQVVLRRNEFELIKIIKEEYIPSVNQHLLSHSTDTKAPSEVDDIFVEPNIIIRTDYYSKDEELVDVEEEKLNIELICKSDYNHLIFGTKESGKTILLDKILIQFSNNIETFHKIPVFIDFNEIGNKRIATLIGQYLRIGQNEVKNILADYKIVLLIDNISFKKNDINILKRLDSFIKTHTNTQIIATSLQAFESEIPLAYFENSPSLNFRIASVKSFKSDQIRQLIEKWFSTDPEYYDTEKLDNLLRILIALNIPRTPLAISMFLWIIEKQENYKPINQSTMLQNFIEKLFDKHTKFEIYSEEFDIKNKIRLLAEIAHQMYKKSMDNYALEYSELFSFVNHRLKIKKFDFDAAQVLDHFLAKGILIREKSGSDILIRFRFTCFFQYFLMIKMDIDPTFRNFVLEESNYLFFIEEIDYYTGIKRDQVDILKTMMYRLECEFKDIIEIIEKQKFSYDTIFRIKKTFVDSINKNFVKEIERTGKPQKEEMDKIRDDILESIKPEKGIEKKGFKISPFQKLDRIFSLCAKLLKNNEEIEEIGLKADSYELLLKAAMAHAIIYRIFTEEYLRKYKKSTNPQVHEMFTISRQLVPFLYQIILHILMNTAKLKLVIKEKMDKDFSEKELTDFEKYLSVFLYSDLRGEDYEKYIKKFVKLIKHKYMQDMVLFKVLTYYFFRSKSKSSDRIYLNIIADIIIKNKGLKKSEKGGIIKRYRKLKSKKTDKDQLSLNF